MTAVHLAVGRRGAFPADASEGATVNIADHLGGVAPQRAGKPATNPLWQDDTAHLSGCRDGHPTRTEVSRHGPSSPMASAHGAPGRSRRNSSLVAIHSALQYAAARHGDSKVSRQSVVWSAVELGAADGKSAGVRLGGSNTSRPTNPPSGSFVVISVRIAGGMSGEGPCGSIWESQASHDTTRVRG
jgi:hypothetical protein